MNNFENTQYYGGRFTDNILVVGQKWCGKTIFVQNFGKNKMFANLKSVY